MALEGTVVNGVLVFDGPPPPEGTRVRMEIVEDDFDDVAPPPPTETREEFLTSLRESIANVNDGQGVDARQFLKELAIKKKLPLLPGE